MKKSLIFSLVIISTILISTFALAVGSSTRSQNSQTNTNVNTNTQASASCDSKITNRERVKCRLETRQEELGTIEESCKNNYQESRCIALQNSLNPCYDVPSGIEKRACLYRVVGVQVGHVNGATNQQKRELATSFLYELQERIEKKHEAKIITSDQASLLIDQIVNIKQKLLTNAPLSEIRPLMLQFKDSYKEIMR